MPKLHQLAYSSQAESDCSTCSNVPYQLLPRELIKHDGPCKYATCEIMIYTYQCDITLIIEY